MRAVRQVERKYYKWSDEFVDTNYIPTMTSLTAPSGTITNSSGIKDQSDANRRCWGSWGKDNSQRTSWNSTTPSTTYTPSSYIPAGNYQVCLKLGNYDTWSTWTSAKITVTYSDDTSENVYTITSELPQKQSGLVFYDYSGEFITTKQIKSITFSGTSSVGNNSSGYVSSIYLRNKTIEEGTPENYDYYKDIPTYKLPEINNIYYGINQ